MFNTAPAMYSRHSWNQSATYGTLGSIMLQDVEAGRQTEVDMLAGTVIKWGKRHRVPTPVNQQFFDELKRMECTSMTLTI
jgi:ketopantoate reductase